MKIQLQMQMKIQLQIQLQMQVQMQMQMQMQMVCRYGGCVHNDNGPLGSRTFARAEERRVQRLKAAGYNAIRTSHNPVSPAFLDACDRLGVIVMDEAFDCWDKGKNPDDYNLCAWLLWWWW